MRVDYKGMMIHGSAAEIVAFIRLYDGPKVKPTTIPPWDVPFVPTPWKPGVYIKTTTGDSTVTRTGDRSDETFTD